MGVVVVIVVVVTDNYSIVFWWHVLVCVRQAVRIRQKGINVCGSWVIIYDTWSDRDIKSRLVGWSRE